MAIRAWLRGCIVRGCSTCAFLYVPLNDSSQVDYYAYLAGRYKQAGHKQMESVFRYVTYKIQSITVLV